MISKQILESGESDIMAEDCRRKIKELSDEVHSKSQMLCNKVTKKLSKKKKELPVQYANS